MTQRFLTYLRSEQSYRLFLRSWFGIALIGTCITLINLLIAEEFSVPGRLFAGLHLASNALLIVPAGVALFTRSRIASQVVAVLSWAFVAVGAIRYHGFTRGHLIETRMWGSWVDDATTPAIMVLVFASLGTWALFAMNRNTLPGPTDDRQVNLAR